ncbi:MAG: beta-glucosidase [Frankiales bacterium]|nr:beta-glucosidase [Frankiales bacterium]
MERAWHPGDPATTTDGRRRSSFPPDFLWGTATASYQIEGSVDVDGRGPSIWDTFSHTPGKTANGETGDVACDHYARMPEDVALMAGLGVNAYRFSIAWPRIEPEDGAVEMRGVAFYDRLVDALLERGIAPVATLYHWDLPQWAEDAGGWLSRDTAERFADHAEWMVENLGDRVHTWITLNEPVVAATFGYGFGTHAPGRTLLFESFTATHHLLLAHGLAVRAMRAASPHDLRIGITHNLSPVHAESGSEADRRAAVSMDAIQNRMYMDPVLLGTYPDEEQVGIAVDRSCVLEGDLALVSSPLDVVGINYYNPTLVSAPGEGNPLPFELKQYPSDEVTDMGWPVVPDGLRDVLVQQRDRYGELLPPVMVTENGVAVPDVLVDGEEPVVDDPRRVEYLRSHIGAVGAAIDEGVDVRGYFCWSFLDNFEWAEGYRPRFGLVYTDYPTQRRIPKTSFAWYRAFLEADA